jgi:DNA polymerase III sliding clamp (beta) subunit (PCNA family)
MIIKTKTLQAAADQAKKIVSNNTPSTIKQFPVLSTIKLDVNMYGLRLTSTDLTNTYQNTITTPSNVAADWSACVDAGALAKLLKNISADVVDISLIEDDKLRIDTAKTAYKLPTMQADEFPQVLKDVGPWLPVTSINSDDLKNLSLSAADYDSNNILSAINYDPCGRFTTCNGNTLIVFKGTKTDCYNAELNIFSGIVKNLPAKTDFYIWTDKNLTRLSNGDEHFYTKNLEGQFPRYMQLIPQHNDDVMSISNKELTAALKEVETTLNARTSIVRFNFDIENQLIYLLSDTPDVGETKTRVETLCSDIRELKYNEIAFNHSYLKVFNKLGDRVNFILDPIRSLSGVKLTFDNNYTGLLMPVQIR